jgi:hypothetical protein
MTFAPKAVAQAFGSRSAIGAQQLAAIEGSPKWSQGEGDNHNPDHEQGNQRFGWHIRRSLVFAGVREGRCCRWETGPSPGTAGV